jgi:hypothetical protein
LSTADFYENLTTFKEFKRIAEPVIYQKFPGDWVVVIADVKGSTVAIREGRYRDVNLMGTACITSVLNVCGRQHIPFIFGGDGATLVIPAHQVDTVKKALSSVFEVILAKIFFHFKLKAGSFSAEGYKKEISENTDFRKFDDSLRMVIDCSALQISEIQKHFDGLLASKKIFYGLHASPEAIMTCLVFSPFNNQHIHFVDGSHGGYAMAATQLKAQMKGEN